MKANRILLAFGLVLFAAFLFSGAHLMRVVKPGHLEDGAIRMMARANHIYLLFVSLLITASSLVDSEFGARWIRLCVRLGQLLLALAAFPLLAAYFTEHARFGAPRLLTMAGCILALAGTALLAAKALDRRDASPW